MLATAVAVRRLLLAAGLVATPLLAQPAAMVKDIGTEIAGLHIGPLSKAVLAGVSYFHVDDGIHGGELWRSDGTPDGTRLVADLCPGICPGVDPWKSVTAWAGRVYFVGDDGVHGPELWRTDGTAGGTEMVADLHPSLRGGLAQSHTEIVPTPSRLYFVAETATEGIELWSTLGTAATTALVMDINPSGSSNPTRFMALGDTLLFFADDGVHGCELWRTEGTAATTSLVKDLAPGPGSADFSGLGASLNPLDRSTEVLGSQAFFVATDGLWRSDGTMAGTELIFSSANILRGLTAWNGRVYFSESTGTIGLWATDGTGAGTTQVVPGLFTSFRVALPGALLLEAADASHGRELWVSDGTAGGTHLLKDIRPGTESSLGGYALLPRRATSPAFFWADDGIHGRELWRSDGTEDGTFLVEDIIPGGASGAYSFLGMVDEPSDIGGRFVFQARYDAAAFAPGIWVTDGTDANTSLLRRAHEQADLAYIFRGFVWSPPVGGPPGAAVGQYSLSLNDSPRPVWFSDGTEAGTVAVHPDARPNFQGSWVGNLHVFPVADEALQTQALWATNGSPAFTQPLMTWNSPDLWPATFVQLGSHDYFSAPDKTLWRTDGTVGGTQQVDAATSGPLSSLGPSLYYSRLLSLNPQTYELLRTTTALGPPQSLGTFPYFTHVLASSSGAVFFSSTAGTLELRRVTESPLGTAVVASWSAEFGSEFFGYTTGPVSNGAKVFYVRDDGGDAELWATDGTPAGTGRVIDLWPGPVGSFPRELTVVGSEVFFVADDGVHGRELFATGGTEAGTRLVADIIPGPGSSHPKDLAVPNGYLVFSATDGVANRELWVSSGTVAGTFRLQDIAPGALPSSPQGFTLGNNRIFFLANDATHGFELWSMAAAQSAIRVTLEALPAAAAASARSAETSGSAGRAGAEFGYIGRALLTCTNNGPSPATNVSCALVNPPPGTTIDCTPPTPAAQLGVGQSIVCDVRFPWSGPVILTGSASSTTSDPFPSDNLASVSISAPAEHEEIPTLSQWGLALMALALFLLALKRFKSAAS